MHQQSAIDQVKGQLWSHWLPKCLDVFRRLPPVPINNNTKAYFRCMGWFHMVCGRAAAVAGKVNGCLYCSSDPATLSMLGCVSGYTCSGRPQPTLASAGTATHAELAKASPSMQTSHIPPPPARLLPACHWPHLPLACRCVAALQGNMLHQLVSASLADYLAFFRQHAAMQPLDVWQETAVWACAPVFETQLTAQDGGLICLTGQQVLQHMAFTDRLLC